MVNPAAELKSRIRAAYKAYRKVANLRDELQIENKNFQGEGDLDYHQEGIEDGIGYEYEELQDELKNPSIGAIQGWFQQEIEARKKVYDLQNGIHSYQPVVVGREPDDHDEHHQPF